MDKVLRVALIAIACLAAALVAHADSATPFLNDEQPLVISNAEGNVAGLLYRGKLMLRGQAAEQPEENEQKGQSFKPSHWPDAFRPDRVNRLPGRVNYRVTFDPSISPYKRVSALDAVAVGSDGITPVLGIRTPERIRIQVKTGQRPATDRDVFLGRIVLRFHDSRVRPLPSVSPDSEILSLRAEPEFRFQLSKDGADNYFIENLDDHPSVQPIVIEYLMDAPKSYFGAPLEQEAIESIADLAPEMPEEIRQQALNAAETLGLNGSHSIRTVVHTLTKHFRNFEESDTPAQDSGDVFADIVMSNTGLCRHRSYGFVLLAQALGIPARFVQNEAHSWVEVFTASAGWMRIDLGGAAVGLQEQEKNNREQYQPQWPDPFPKPPAYKKAYAVALTWARLQQALKTTDAQASQLKNVIQSASSENKDMSLQSSKPVAAAMLSTPDGEVWLTPKVQSEYWLGAPIEIQGRLRAASDRATPDKIRIRVKDQGGKIVKTAEAAVQSDGRFSEQVMMDAFAVGTYRVEFLLPDGIPFQPQ